MSETAIATVGQMTPAAPAAGEVFMPRTMGEAWKLSETFHESGLLPRGVSSPAAAFTIIATGAELGLSPMASLRSIHIIEGKPVLSAALIAGIVQRRPDLCEGFALVESSETIATYETTRRGQTPVRMSFTIEQAQRAGLTGKDIWRKYPHAMLRARASAELARAVYPDVVGGLYDPDEIPGAEVRTVEPRPVVQSPPQQAQRRTLAAAPPASSAETLPAPPESAEVVCSPPSERADDTEAQHIARLAELATAGELAAFSASVPADQKTPRLRAAFSARLAAVRSAQ